MQNAITHETRTIVATQIREFYARKWHWVDPRDIEQQAHLHLLEASLSLPAEVEHPHTFLWCAVTPELVVWLWKQSKPMTVTKYAVRESKKNLELYRSAFIEHDYVSATADFAAEYERAQWVATVQARIRELLTGADNEVISVLLGDKKPREVARHGDVRSVYWATRTARRRMERDPDLQRLWLER